MSVRNLLSHWPRRAGQVGRIQTYAVSGSSREGHICVGMASLCILRKEPLWLEFLRIGEVFWISVQCIGNDDCLRALCHVESRCQEVVNMAESGARQVM